MHKYLPCTLSRLSSPEPGAIVRVSGCLPGLHPIHLYRFGMTDVPFAAVSAGLSLFWKTVLSGVRLMATIHRCDYPKRLGFPLSFLVTPFFPLSRWRGQHSTTAPAP